MRAESLSPRTITTLPTAREAPSASSPGPLSGGDDETRAPLDFEREGRSRRRFERYSPVRDQLWVGWWDEDDFLIDGGRIVNISQGGVQISLGVSPPQGQPVWLRLEGGARNASLRAVVLEAKWTIFQRRYSVRLAFEQTCPEEQLIAVVHVDPHIVPDSKPHHEDTSPAPAGTARALVSRRPGVPGRH